MIDGEPTGQSDGWDLTDEAEEQLKLFDEVGEQLD